MNQKKRYFFPSFRPPVMRAAVLFGALAAGLLPAAAPALAIDSGIDRMSSDSSNMDVEGNSFSDTWYPGVRHISDDNRYVVYISTASNLVDEVTDKLHYHIYVYDTVDHSNELVDVAYGVEPIAPGNASSEEPSISADGRYVAFRSKATDLVDGGTNGKAQIFVRDLMDGTTVLVSADNAGTQGNQDSVLPAISADGSYVAFQSKATNLDSIDTTSFADIFVRDLIGQTTELVSIASDDLGPGDDDSAYPAISANGRYVAFQSFAGNLVDDDTDGYIDIFVRDLDGGTTGRVSVDSVGNQGIGDSFHPSISADGLYVAFQSYAKNLVASDANNNFADIFVHDRGTGVTELVSVASGGTPQGNFPSYDPSINADGRYVAFYSEANNLVADDLNNRLDVFVHDRMANTTIRVNTDEDENEADDYSAAGTISPDGALVAFTSRASNLVYATSHNTNNLQTFVKVTGLEPSLLSNAPPVADAGGPYTVDEGGTVGLDAGGSEDPDGDPLTYAWDLDEDGFFDDATGSMPTFDAAGLDGPSLVTVKVQVSDGNGESDIAAAEVTVGNVAPVVGDIAATPSDPLPLGAAVTLGASFTDAGTPDTHSAAWDWGDGSSSAGTVAQGAGGGSVEDSHSYAGPGVYTVELTVTDDDGGEDSAIYQYVVVYDPNGAFVTGGGTIVSPAGAYTPDPSLAGDANFGFVSKYKKGATLPTGHTEFQFHAADFEFQSSSYQWLVVAGPQAIFKGTGTIAGMTGSYGFLLAATDGDVSGGGGADKFRIKIWDAADDSNVIYDNQMGADDDAEPTTTIKSGSIVIHSKGKK